VEYIDSVEAPALHRCAKHCGQVKAVAAIRDSQWAIPEPPRRPRIP